MQKVIDWFLWGLCMGMGWAIANNILNFSLMGWTQIVQELRAAH